MRKSTVDRINKLVGNQYGRLRVIERDLEKGKGYSKGRYLICECSCGNITSIRFDSLERGNSTSCGCLANELASKRWKTHGLSRHEISGIYNGMVSRCTNPENQDYDLYGGRGITVCDRWSYNTDGSGLKAFIEDMYSDYSKGMELDRIDFNKGYSKENCRWTDRKTQVNNRRLSREVRYLNYTLSLTEWGHLLCIPNKILNDRVNKLGWDDPDKLLSGVTHKKQYQLSYNNEIYCAKELIEKHGFNYNSASSWKNKYGSILEGMRAHGIEFEVIDDRVYQTRSPEEGIDWIKSKDDLTLFEEHILLKIKTQEENNV